VAVADVLGSRWPARLLGAHLVVDESVAFTIRQEDPHRRRAAFWATGASLFVVWNLSVLGGVLAGRFLRDTDAIGLDAAFPAVLLALVLPTIGEGSRRPVVLGAALAVAATTVLPPGLPVLVSLLGLVLLPRRSKVAAS
jgi:predicted branched-subunit amino acid permease